MGLRTPTRRIVPGNEPIVVRRFRILRTPYSELGCDMVMAAWLAIMITLSHGHMGHERYADSGLDSTSGPSDRRHLKFHDKYNLR